MSGARVSPKGSAPALLVVGPYTLGPAALCEEEKERGQEEEEKTIKSIVTRLSLPVATRAR